MKLVFKKTLSSYGIIYDTKIEFFSRKNNTIYENRYYLIFMFLKTINYYYFL